MTRTAEVSVLNGRGDSICTQVSASMTELEPVKRLMFAVLDGAVSDFRTYAAVRTGRGRRLFADVDTWFSSPACGPFDFETICHATGLDPDYIRKGLHASRPSTSPKTDGARGAKSQDRGPFCSLCEAV